MSKTVPLVDDDVSNDSSEVFVLSSVSIPCSTSTPDESSLTTPDTVDNIQKIIRDKFYVNVTKYDTNWAGECIVCGKIQYDSKAITSNTNRRVKT